MHKPYEAWNVIMVVHWYQQYYTYLPFHNKHKVEYHMVIIAAPTITSSNLQLAHWHNGVWKKGMLYQKIYILDILWSSYTHDGWYDRSFFVKFSFSSDITGNPNMGTYPNQGTSRFIPAATSL